MKETTDQPLTGPALRAILYMRTIRADCNCRDLCAAKGWRVVGVVLDPDGSRFADVQDAVYRGEAELLVACSRADLPPDRVPRIETETSAKLKAFTAPRQRRPRRR